MSLHAYHYSVKLGHQDPPFEALIMAAMMKADPDNLFKLRQAFPNILKELWARFEAPMGVIPEDGEVEMALLSKQIKRLEEIR